MCYNTPIPNHRKEVPPLKRSRLVRALALLLALTLLPSPVRAVGQVYFTAVNNNMLLLSSDTMPTWFDGTLYVPYNVFDDNTTNLGLGMGLGTYGSYSTANQTVTLYNLSRMMIFDLEEGSCYDHRSGRTYPSPAIIRNGLPYVPVGQVCSYFDLTYSYLNVTQGILVRIKSSGLWMSDATFIDAAQDSMNRRLREYNQGQSYTPPAADPVPPASEESPENIPLYLGVRCQGGGFASNLADLLDAQGARGLFFLPPDQLQEQDDLVRRLLATGHSVGLLLTGDTLEESREQLEQGCRLLREMVCLRPSALLCPEGQRDELEQEGWTCWRETASLRPDLSSQEQARVLRGQELVRLTLDDTGESAGAAHPLLYQLKNWQFDICLPLETRL